MPETEPPQQVDSNGCFPLLVPLVTVFVLIILVLLTMWLWGRFVP